MSNETRVRDGTAHQARSHNGHLTQVVHFEEVLNSRAMRVLQVT